MPFSCFFVPIDMLFVRAVWAILWYSCHSIKLLCELWVMFCLFVCALLWFRSMWGHLETRLSGVCLLHRWVVWLHAHKLQTNQWTCRDQQTICIAHSQSMLQTEKRAYCRPMTLHKQLTDEMHVLWLYFEWSSWDCVAYLLSVYCMLFFLLCNWSGIHCFSWGCIAVVLSNILSISWTCGNSTVSVCVMTFSDYMHMYSK